MIQAPIVFAALNQEIITVSNPTNDSRASVVVGGSVASGVGHIAAINGTCDTFSGVILRNMQV
jgi:hypothetical protein